MGPSRPERRYLSTLVGTPPWSANSSATHTKHIARFAFIASQLLGLEAHEADELHAAILVPCFIVLCLLRGRVVSSIPIHLENDNIPRASSANKFLHRVGWLLYYAACLAILAACFLAWVAMLSPYRSPPDTIKAYEKAEAQGRALVWVNTNSHIYHYPGQRWYGHTIQGKYMKESDAIAEGDHATANGQ